MSSIISEDGFGFEYNHWLSRKLATFLNMLMIGRGASLPSVESIKKVKISNFMVAPGRVMCRAQNGTGALVKIEIFFKEFDFQTWAKIISAVSLNAYLASKLYLGELPEEMESIFLNNNASLVPPDINDITIFQDGREIDKPNYYSVAAIEKLAARFEEEPFAAFLLRGYEKGDFVSELRKVRTNLQKQHMAKLAALAANLYQKEQAELEQAQNEEINVTKFLERACEIGSFWKCGEDISQLQFSIRADDLPASILRWLEPLPLSGLENKISYQLEEVYAHVAKRAHSFGLGL